MTTGNNTSKHLSSLCQAQIVTKLLKLNERTRLRFDSRKVSQRLSTGWKDRRQALSSDFSSALRNDLCKCARRQSKANMFIAFSLSSALFCMHFF